MTNVSHINFISYVYHVLYLFAYLTDWLVVLMTFMFCSKGAMVLGAGVTAYGISNIIWDMTKMFITLTPAATGYYGFVGGIFSTSILGGLAYYTERW